MKDSFSIKNAFSNNWLFLFVIMQPLLDILAFWTSSETGTVAGYIRLMFMIIFPLHLLLSYKDRKSLIFSLGIIVALALAHVLNLFRVGYINVVSDVKNMAKIMYLPIMAVCLCCYVQDEKTKKQVVNGLLVNCFLLASVIIISYVTGTYNPTYGYGLGTSAWVTDQNRCTHSVILSALCIFSMYFGLGSKNKIWHYLAPVAVLVVCISNGTSSCYLTLLACLAGFAFFRVFCSVIRREKLCKADKLLVLYLIALFAFSIVIYPVTPRAKITEIERAAAEKRQGGLEAELLALGYDVRNMSPEERMNEPVVREKMAEFYTKTIYGGAPGLIESFDVYRIMDAFGMTTDANVISDVRRMKRVNAHLIWEDSDFATKLTGFEFAKVDWPGDPLDLENDWHAIFYYYGVFGFAAYALYMLYILFLVIRKLMYGFKENLTEYNFALLLSFIILIGLAHFSGALLKRPNSSIYMALIISLLSYQTRYAVDKKTIAGECEI